MYSGTSICVVSSFISVLWIMSDVVLEFREGVSLKRVRVFCQDAEYGECVAIRCVQMCESSVTAWT